MQQNDATTIIQQQDGMSHGQDINNDEPIIQDEVDSAMIEVPLDANSPTTIPSDSHIHQVPVTVVPDTPLPWKPLIIVLFMFIVDALSITTLGPYISDLIIYMGLVPDGDKRKIGRYAGLLSTSYSVAQFFSAYLWGLCSDKYGRKPVLLWGILGASISSLLFGFSNRLWFALATRFLYGTLNGNLGVYKTYLAEISDKSNQARVFTLMSVTFSLGSIIGPLLSGLTSDPLKQYSSLKDVLPSFLVTLLTKFPFLLPNLIISMMCFIAFLLSIFFLKETNRVVLAKRAQIQKQAETQLEEMQVTIQAMDDGEELRESKELRMTELDDEEQLEQQDQTLFQSSQTKKIPTAAMTWGEYLKNKMTPESEIFLTYSPLATVALYSLYGFVGTVFMELMPLLLVLKVEDGGLNFVQRQLGMMNAISFVFLLLWSLIFVPILIKRLGCLWSFRLSVIVATPFILLFPAVNFLVFNKVLMWAGLIFVYVARHSLFQVVFSSMTIMSNNSVTSGSMGRLNGISQSTVALTRSFGPVFGSSLFAVTLQVNHFPFNRYFMYMLISVLWLFLLLISVPLPKSLEEPRLTKYEDQDKN